MPRCPGQAWSSGHFCVIQLWKAGFIEFILIMRAAPTPWQKTLSVGAEWGRGPGSKSATSLASVAHDWNGTMALPLLRFMSYSPKNARGRALPGPPGCARRRCEGKECVYMTQRTIGLIPSWMYISWGQRVLCLLWVLSLYEFFKKVQPFLKLSK